MSYIPAQIKTVVIVNDSDCVDGNLKYAKTLLEFKFGLWRKGFFSFGNFVVGGFGHVAVCLLPNSLRVLFYKVFLW